MATIPDTQQFHTVAGKVDTVNKGSELANSDRQSYTMQDIKDTVSAGGGVDGSGTAGQLSKWSDANTLTDSIVTETITGIGLVGNVVATGVIAGASLKVGDALNTAPASASDTGTKGEIRFVNEGGGPPATGAIYLCIATDTWVKVALATF